MKALIGGHFEISGSPVDTSIFTIYTLCRFLLRSVAPRQLARAEQSEQQQRGFKRSLSVRMKKVFSRPSVKERKGSNNSDEAKERPKEKELEPPPGALRRSLTNPDTVMERRRRQAELSTGLREISQCPGNAPTA